MSDSGTLFTISAPSGAGKTSLVKELLQVISGLQLSISHTTRSIRPGEVDGEDYFFIETDRFKAMIENGDFLEYAEVFGNYYGTSQLAIAQQLRARKDALLEIDWQGAEQVRKKIQNSVSIFILPPSLGALEERLLSRGQDSEAIISKRMAEAVSEIKHFSDYDFLIINDDFQTALAELITVIRCDRLKLERQQRRHQALITQLLA